MSRIRTIKPEFFRSVTLASVSRDARLLFAGLWTYVDDGGRGIDEPRLIKGELFPMDDDMTASVVESLLTDLARVGVVVRYEVAGRRYLAVKSFAEHQKIDRAKTSKLPAPSDGTIVDASRTPAAPSSKGADVPPDGARDESSNDRRQIDDGSTIDRRGKGTGNREGIPVGTADAVPREVPRDDASSRPTPPAPAAVAAAPDAPTAPTGPPFANWVSAFGDAWKAQRGGASPQLYGRIGRTLAKLVEERGQEAVWPAWLRFLASDKAEYGPQQFADNFASFSDGGGGLRVVRNGRPTPAGPAGSGDDPLSSLLTPPALRQRFAEFDLTRPLDQRSYAERVARACPDGMEAAAWARLVERVHPSDLGTLTFGPEIEQRIAQRLTTPTGTNGTTGSHGAKSNGEYTGRAG